MKTFIFLALLVLMLSCTTTSTVTRSDIIYSESETRSWVRDNFQTFLASELESYYQHIQTIPQVDTFYQDVFQGDKIIHTMDTIHRKRTPTFQGFYKFLKTQPFE